MWSCIENESDVSLKGHQNEKGERRVDNIVREQIEDVLRSKNVGSRKMRRKEKEEWFLSLFDDAMQTRAPGKEDVRYLQRMFDDMVNQVPISDLVIVCFNLGRVYERKKKVEVV